MKTKELIKLNNLMLNVPEELHKSVSHRSIDVIVISADLAIFLISSSDNNLDTHEREMISTLSNNSVTESIISLL